MELGCSNADRCEFKGTAMCLICVGKIKDNQKNIKDHIQDNTNMTTEEKLKAVKQQLMELNILKLRLEKQLKREKKGKKKGLFF